MRSVWAGLLLPGLLMSAPAGGEEPSAPVARTGLHTAVSSQPEGAVHVGELVRVLIDVGSETRFSVAPRFPELRLPGAIAVVPDPLPAKYSRRIDGREVQFIRHVVVVFPLRPGSLEIPALEVVAGGEVDGRATGPLSLATPPLAIEVQPVPGTDPDVALPATPALVVEEVFEPALEELELAMGDSVTRTVTLQAERSLGLMLPDLAFPGPDGVTVYPDPPVLEDRANRGRYSGTRIERITYVFERPGTRVLPELRIPWWNSGSQRLEETVLPERTVTVVASPAQLAELAWEQVRARGPFWIAVVLFLWAIRKPVCRGLRWAWRAALDARRRRLEGEAHAFRVFRRACRRGDLDGMASTFWRWRDRIGHVPPEGLRAARNALGEQHAILGRFERARYGRDATGMPAPHEVGRAVGKLRRALRAQASSPPPGDVLNPVA